MAKPWEDMSYDERRRLSLAVESACARQDLDKLKELLPTLDSFVSFSGIGTVNGSILHLLMKAPDRAPKETKISQLDFMKKVMAAYDLDSHPEEKAKLLLRRTFSGKLAADFSYIYNFLDPEIRNVFAKKCGRPVSASTVDTRTPYEKGKVAMYNYLKEEIKKVRPQTTPEQAHALGQENAPGIDGEWNPYDKGVPVSPGVYLAGADGKPGAYMSGSIKETYPEIRLRNVGDQETGKKEDFCTLRGLDLDSSESLLSRALDRIDFPEDFYRHFDALNLFEQQYKKMRENDGSFASYRYLTQHRGVVIFEDTFDKEHQGNNKPGAEYNGYHSNQGIIVVRSDWAWSQGSENWILLHELYHDIDLFAGATYSDTPFVKFGLMLTQQDKHNPVTEPFETVDSYYPPSEFSKEMTAQVMENLTVQSMKEAPLLRNIYQIGKIFALGKADGVPAIANRIQHALDNHPNLPELIRMYQEFMLDKEEYYRRETDIKNRYTGAEQTQRLRDLSSTHQLESRRKNDATEEKRHELAILLEGSAFGLKRTLAKLYQMRGTAGKVVLSGAALSLDIGDKLHEEVVASVQSQTLTPETLQKQSEIIGLPRSYSEYPEHNRELLKAATMVRQLWDTKFKGTPVQDELPDILDLRKKDLKRRPSEIVKSISLFAKGLEENRSEMEIRTALFTGKDYSLLTDRDFILFNVRDGQEKCYTHPDGEEWRVTKRTHAEIFTELDKYLQRELTQTGRYDVKSLPNFFERAEKNNLSLDAYKNFEIVLGYIHQGLTQEAMAKVLRIASYEIECKDIIAEKLSEMPNGGKGPDQDAGGFIETLRASVPQQPVEQKQQLQNNTAALLKHLKDGPTQ